MHEKRQGGAKFSFVGSREEPGVGAWPDRFFWQSHTRAARHPNQRPTDQRVVKFEAVELGREGESSERQLSLKRSDNRCQVLPAVQQEAQGIRHHHKDIHLHPHDMVGEAHPNIRTSPNVLVEE